MPRHNVPPQLPRCSLGNGSYYSNQDITILHSVVVAAQEELDHASEPKPLPAAVLFRAYDDVLPVYGVDPDLDHHLSALVFRIGGEQGHGTLLSKFQAILGRMGIVLEFGDDTPSPEASPVFFPSPTSSFRSRLNFDVERIMSESNLNNGSDVTTAALSSADHVLQPGGEIFPEENTEIADTPVGTAMDLKSESKDAGKTSSLDGRRSALAAAFDLWRSRAAANLRQIEGLHDDRPMHNRWAPKESNNGPAEIPGQLKRDDGFYALSDDIITLSQEHHLVQCASRARQIYLASKILNHWADRTAIRLEREAVARRHMIRFRCFRAWSQAPSSRLPAVDRLRASTAVQKLQRAVAYHRSGLSQSASSTAEARSAGLVQQALARWQCRISAHNSLCTSIKRTKLDTASRWREDAWGTQALGHAATAHCADWQSHMAMQKWRARADKSKLSQKVAHHIRTLCLYSNCLDTWSDCAEVKQRSSTYRQRLYLDRAAFAFYVWNLSARAQAVRWRREFLLVESAFNAWSSGAARNTGARSAAHQHHVLDSKTRVCRRLKRLQSERANLTRLHSRAQLYLHGTRLLKVFDLTVRLRKDRTKSRIRRHLMMRYTQISSSRKKRTFLAALDRWKLASERDSRMAQTAQEFDFRRLAAAVQDRKPIPDKVAGKMG
ncbi:centrin-binding protein Sfi1 [Ophiocordyceps camponoti-floridani]|uniref:Centrin-binding protein Sfi1 n=1 Tax=Ophiocordyceps camponoti-floridani TaxID=2030778 RepID=A0A8H4QBH4_9HYPO|nr:centrin-binding protein Sfi1 [Ophiocordyceps camponoti-floridani]